MTKKEKRREEFVHILQELYQTLLERKNADPATSYVASLYQQGINKILQKIGEESYELILAGIDVENMLKTGRKHSNEAGKKFAAFNENEQAIIKKAINEVADLWFHLLVFLAFLDFELTKIDLRMTYEMLDFANNMTKEEKTESFAKTMAYYQSDKAYKRIHNEVFKLIKTATNFEILQKGKEHKDFSELKSQAIYILDSSLAKLSMIPDVSLYDVAKVLQQRMGISGFDEKSARLKP